MIDLRILDCLINNFVLFKLSLLLNLSNKDRGIIQNDGGII